MHDKLLRFMAQRPAPYAPGTAPFWDDPHISKYMLEAHLNPDYDAASRKHAFIKRSADWIASLTAAGSRLLDLGCGPGLYGQAFRAAGLRVTGIDMAPRSIEYARRTALEQGLDIEYRLGSYLELEDENAFDVITLIYCDFGVLPPDCQRELLRRIRRALRRGGLFIMDGWTERQMDTFAEGWRVSYKDSGFWSASPYVCVEGSFRYREQNAYLEQHIVCTGEDCNCYNIWNTIYSPDSLGGMLREAGLGEVTFCSDVAGAPWREESPTLCALAR